MPGLEGGSMGLYYKCNWGSLSLPDEPVALLRNNRRGKVKLPSGELNKHSPPPRVKRLNFAYGRYPYKYVVPHYL